MTGMTIGKLSAGIAIVSMMFAAIVLISGDTNAEGYPITVTGIYRYHNAATTYSYFDMTIDTSIDEVPDGTYPGWCVQLGVPIGSFPASATLYNTYDTTHPFQSKNWGGINWLINTYDCPDDFSYEVMEMALWGIMGDDYWINEWYDEDENTPKPSLPAETKDLVDDLIAGAGENDDYMPATSDDVVLYLIYISATRQTTIIEVPFEPEDDDDDEGTRTIGYWKTHEEVWDEWDPGMSYWDETEPSIFQYNEQSDAMYFFPSKGDKMETWEMVRVQLLGAELNFYYFGPGTSWDFAYEGNITEWMEKAYDFLYQYCDIDTDGDWTYTGPTKTDSGWADYKSEGSEIIAGLDWFNNSGDDYW